MAKKKVSEVESGHVMTQDEFTDRLYAETAKDFGEGVMTDGLSAVNDKQSIIPWTPTLDIITSGGILEGSWVGLTGHPKSGKSSCCLAFAANAQKPENGSRPIYYNRVEGRLSLHHLQQVKDLKLDRGKFTIIQSVKGKILSTQDHLKILMNVIRTVPKAVVIIDSISAYVDEKELNDGIGTETRGGGAKLFSQFCRLMNQVVPTNKTIVLGITQLISNTSGFGAQFQERCARMWTYQCDYQLRAISKARWEVGDKQIGLITKWQCNTSALGPPGMSIESYLRFGVGYDRLYEMITLAMSANLIQKGGSWYTMPFLLKHLPDGSGIPKFQGGEKLYEAIVAHPEWETALQKEVTDLSLGAA
jgi:recombination protein RecA